jgi:exopolyphosphatase/guanosine-5'-triphosphate,3'-diphosphate pyrophosphatase
VHLAAKEKVNFRNKLALLVDIGGGSVEVSVADEKNILVSESYTIGSVRLLQILGEEKIGEKRFNQLVRQYVDATHRRLKKEIGSLKIQMCIGAGGSIESLAELRREIYSKHSASHVSLDELRGVMKMLHSLSFQERIQQLRLRPDRADVIVPAGIVLLTILEQAGLQEVNVPGIGLKDGLLLETISELFHRERNSLHEQVLTSALQVGHKYCFDEQHAQTVSRLAMSIFDQLEPYHGLNSECRMLLQVAALLHDVGQFVSLSNHHRHTFYLLQASPVIGLNRKQMDLVAHIARYHRKSVPKLSHKSFENLTPKERLVIAKLASILRLADALDHEHGSKVHAVYLQYRKPGYILTLAGEGDMLLERWAVANKRGLFEEVFGGELIVEETEFWPSRRLDTPLGQNAFRTGRTQ